MDWFWNERFWLPGNYTWEFMVSNKAVDHPLPRHLIYPIQIGVIFICVRYVVEKYVLDVLGRKLGVVPAVRPNSGNSQTDNNGSTHHQTLLANYEKLKRERGKNGGSGKNNQNGSLERSEVETLAGNCGLSVRHVERWLRQQRKWRETRPARLKKFSESGWRFICYLSLSLFGASVLFTKSWFWNFQECWIGWPHTGVDRDIWWYYLTTCGFYWSLLLTQFLDVKRKDFGVMLTHHAITIAMMCFAWVVNLSRFGSIIVIFHDMSDAPLELTKLCIYVKKYKMSEYAFWTFAAAWVIGRLLVLPLVIMPSALFDSLRFMEIPTCPIYYILNIQLAFLFVMHLVWTYYIAQFAKKLVFEKKYVDSRSSDEESDESEVDDKVD